MRTLEESLYFDFHGVRVVVSADDPEVLARIAGDFTFFRVGAEAPHPDLKITARRTEPDYGVIPALRASVYTPRNVCYSDGPRTWMDYFGRALAVYDRQASSFEARTRDAHLLHEIVYLTILSRVSEKLEGRRLHRVHATAFECDGEAAVFLMPSGCGKTTLTLSVLERDLPIRVLSEDSPLIDGSGIVHPFPLRIGTLGPVPPGVPEECVVHLRRMEFEPKTLISLDAFPGRFCETPAIARFVFLGNRFSRAGCHVRPASRRVAAAGLVKHMVVGVGLYQGIEFLLQSSLLDLAAQSRAFSSRLLRAWSLLRRAEFFELDLGPDVARNVDEILTFLESRGFGTGPGLRAQVAAAS